MGFIDDDSLACTQEQASKLREQAVAVRVKETTILKLESQLKKLEAVSIDFLCYPTDCVTYFFVRF